LKNIEKLFDQANPGSDLSASSMHSILHCRTSVSVMLSGSTRDSYRNLISNAIKFTEKGEVVITAMVKEIQNDNVTLEFKVSDTGIGIPADKVSKVFERFEQVNIDSARKPEGTGLGLSITKSLVEMEGGTISVTSKEGVGSEFVFTVSYGLPSTGASQQESVSGEVLVGGDGFPPLAGRVLVVEDNPLNQKLIDFLLRKWGIEFDVARNGVEACSICRTKVILLSYGYPDAGDGWIYRY
jgi:hypothetical protein